MPGEPVIVAGPDTRHGPLAHSARSEVSALAGDAAVLLRRAVLLAVAAPLKPEVVAVLSGLYEQATALYLSPLLPFAETDAERVAAQEAAHGQ